MTNITIAILLLGIAALVAWFGQPILPKSQRRGWLLALFPLTSFLLITIETLGLGGSYQTGSVSWIQSLDLSVSFYFDALSALFSLIVTGIGTLIIVYAGYYFRDKAEARRFFAYLFLFMGMMLGLVLAGDVLTLFIFWEGTSITSFLLVAYKAKSVEARRGAFRALFITGGGGIALLAGLLFTSNIAGGSDFQTILSSGELLTSHPYYLAVLGLVAFGAFTKSAQFPAHIWLPGAMSAPTPASAYLHSATMVKAGVYLLARINPALGNTEPWFWLLSVVGLLTMLLGAFWGVKQRDLKALLAYSTISQLGILVMLIGQDTEIAFKALVIGVVAHALYKSALFMGAGIVDLSTGSRDLRRLQGLSHHMPILTVIVGVAAFSLAGLPPLFGFLAKETLLATAVHPSLPVVISWLFAAVIVIAAAFKIVQAGLISRDLFFGKEPTNHPFSPQPRGMLWAPALPALFSLALAILPEPTPIAQFFGYAAEAAYGDSVKVSFALWTGLNAPFVLSALAIGGGILLYVQRKQIIRWQERLPNLSFDQLYQDAVTGIDRMAFLMTRLQTGKLRTYLTVFIVAMLTLVFYVSSAELLPITSLNIDPESVLGFQPLRIMALIAIVGAAVATALTDNDFFAILAMSVAGLGVAVYMAIEPAPDVALVQIVVDILATIVLVLALSRLPKRKPELAVKKFDSTTPTRLLVSIGSAILVTLITAGALFSRPGTSQVTPLYEENARALTGASDIVGAIIVDFRALDTLIEIVVFGLAGLGVYTLLKFARRLPDNRQEPLPRATSYLRQLSYGISGLPTSSYVQAMANLLLPVALVMGIVHIIYGHEQPGDGFTAGVIIGVAVGFKYVVFGYKETRERLFWIRPYRLIGYGILLAVGSGLLAWLIEGSFLASVDYGKMLGVVLPAGMKFSSGFIFEIAIALGVLGSVAYMLDTLGESLSLATEPEPVAPAESEAPVMASGD